MTLWDYPEISIFRCTTKPIILLRQGYSSLGSGQVLPFEALKAESLHTSSAGIPVNTGALYHFFVNSVSMGFLGAALILMLFWAPEIPVAGYKALVVIRHVPFVSPFPTGSGGDQDCCGHALVLIRQ